ncbi:MAG: adenosylcobinamide-GDP ribazoletransferase [Leptospirillum sp.]|jgi:adenosylcobinamide-GDP ribazoletransferase
MGLFDRLRSTVLFLTRIPLGSSPLSLKLCPEQFPIVGFFLGSAIWGLWVATSSLPSMIRSVLLVIFWAILTGGLHFDGWADTWESALYSGTVEEKLRIRKDPHVGVYGVLALVFLPAFKIACLAALGDRSLGILAIPIFARGILPLSMKTLRFLNPGIPDSAGLGTIAMTSFSGMPYYLGLLITALSCGYLLGIGGSLFMAAGWVAWVLVALWVLKRSDSLSGDFMGWSIESLEAISLFALLLASMKQ